MSRIKHAVLASSNQGKLKELANALEDFEISLSTQVEHGVPDAIEDGLSFIENALKKARHAAQHTGLPAIADDSGLAVDALGGAPGIYSARYADGQGDAANNAKLLDALDGEATRAAAFYCCLAFVRSADDPTPIIAQGVWRGEIATSLEGEGGFGYDPLFIPEGLQASAATLSKEDKLAISHRGKALASLKAELLASPHWLGHE